MIALPTTPSLRLDGRSALVTGAGRGIGVAAAAALAEAGARVTLCARTASEIEEVAASLRERGLLADTLVLDVTDVEAFRRAIETAAPFDIFVNNAGTNRPEPIDQIQDANWDAVLEINLSSLMVLSRAVVPQMKERRWGRVIHISSIMGLASKEGRNAYSATKSALIGLAKASALDLGPFGITVNCIAPGPFMTDLPMNMLSDADKKGFANRTAVGRWGQPRELAGPALLLASDAGSYITGHVLTVDGGTLIKTF